jgi:fructose-specific phosphotransferase system IIC component
LFSVTFAGISLGGHLGGLVGGLITGALITQLSERRRMPALALAGCVVVAVASVIGALAVAGAHGLAPTGVGFGT